MLAGAGPSGNEQAAVGVPRGEERTAASAEHVDRDDAFEAEVLPQLRGLYGMAYRLTRNSHDAEDLVQETLLRAYRAFDSYRPGTNIRAWLFTILHRLRTDALRRRGRSPQTVELVGDGPGVAPTHEAALTSGREDVVRALAAVPESFRVAVVLRDVEDFSYAEIAGILGVPAGTVMSRIHRGRALLREALSGGKT
jgi:RNA polymerase sigma-70 factor (ECF subfamily)